MAIDPATKIGARALERLATDRIAWLTTVDADGQPQSMPIWFLWEPDPGEVPHVLAGGRHPERQSPGEPQGVVPLLGRRVGR